MSVSAIVATVAVFAGAFFFGGRRWRQNYDAEHTRATALQATLVEKDQMIVGQGERLARMDEALQQVGGTQVAQNLVSAQQENLTLFAKIIDHLEKHDKRAEERHHELIAYLKHERS